MTTRPPLQPLSPPFANIINTRSAHNTTKGANGYAPMAELDDTHDLGSVVSALSSLENDAEDEFEKMMIQNARDERRLNAALQGRVQAFRKARTHPNVGLTMDNLERNNARNDVVLDADSHVKFKSPPSSSESTRSDPAIHAPAGWGRKSRANRNWMRSIAYDEEQQQATPVAADDTLDDMNVPRRSVEDSPLSHKSSIQGTPRNDRSGEWDLTFEINEASIIASTPYIPRSTVLDDIRQREIEGLKEQRVTTARLDRIRERSPEETRRPRSSSAQSTVAIDDAIKTEQPTSQPTSPGKSLRTRTNSWKSIGKSQPVTGIGKENSSIAMYTSAEKTAAVEHEVVADARTSPTRPARHRREDSQDLLRRLARVSNTPSPGRIQSSRRLTATVKQAPDSTYAPSLPKTSVRNDTPVEDTQAPEPTSHTPEIAPEATPEQEQPRALPETIDNVPELPPPAETVDIDVTPLPISQPTLNPKTPIVTGAWVDTPGPRAIQKPVTKPTARSPRKTSPHKSEKPDPSANNTNGDIPEATTGEKIRPRLPSSALHKLVEEAKASGRRPSADFGDSTIDSLEELISPLSEGEAEEDTLQGLELPTEPPRNEAERQRQQETIHLHRMNDRLRAARTSIRDANRGMRRVEDRVEHAEEPEVSESDQKGVKIVHVYHEFSMWKWWKQFFWQEEIKTRRQTSNSWWKYWGGLTTLGILTVMFWTWFISESIACEIHCHPLYARRSRYPLSINIHAPRYPWVLPTLFYRTFVKAWFLPLYSLISWMCFALKNIIFGIDVKETLVRGAQRAATATAWTATQVTDDAGWDIRMGDDQLVK